jgi:hypothetical protein
MDSGDRAGEDGEQGRMINIVRTSKRGLRRWSAGVGLGTVVAAVAVVGLGTPASAELPFPGPFPTPQGKTTTLQVSQVDPSTRQVQVAWSASGVSWMMPPPYMWDVVVTPPSGTLLTANDCTNPARPDSGLNNCTFTGGVDGTYTVTVTATTPMGRSPESATRPVTVAQVDSTPSAPRSLKVLPGPQQLGLSWQAPAHLGSGVVGYHVDLYDADDNWVNECPTTTQLTCTITGLTAGVPYVAELWANNADDMSSDSVFSAPTKPLGPVTSTPIPPTVPSSAGTLTASQTSVTPNQSITISGTGFAAGIPIQVAVYSTPQVLKTVTTDGTGAFSTSVAIPAGLTGSHTLVAGGVGPDGVIRYLTVPVTAAGSGGTAGGTQASGSAGGLPVTGVSLPILVTTAVAILLLGVALVRFARRRSAAAPTVVDGHAYLK